MEAVEKCQSTWTIAKSDTEKFAALLIISKILQKEKLTYEEKKAIYQVIGFQYLHRLCISEEDSSSPVGPYSTLALSILSSFCEIEEMGTDPQILLFVPFMVKILELDAPAETVVDILQIILSSVNNPETRQNLLDNGVLLALIKQYKQTEQQKEKILSVFMTLVIQAGNCDVGDIGRLVECLAEEFYTEESLEKFELCNHLLTILLKYPDSISFDSSLHIQKALTNILQSRVGKSQRDPAVKLAGIIVHKFGSRWLLESSEDSKLFFTILVQITTIEIRMLLDEKSIREFSGELFLLSSCYIILETIIEVMVNEGSQRYQRHTEQFCNAINLAFRSVVGFLKSLSDDWKNGEPIFETPNCEDVIVGTIRALCCWLAEETNAFQDEVAEILPFVLEVCKRSSSLTFCSKLMADCRVIQFCFAPLCHLTADDRARQILLDNGLLSLMFSEFNLLWSSCIESEFTESKSSTLHSMCGIFLNIVVLESQHVSESEEFYTFLKFLLTALPQLKNETSYLITKAYFSVLGLLITRHHHQKLKNRESTFYGFLSSSIKFLWDALMAGRINGEMALCVTIEYTSVWTDIMELWFLGMQALSTLLPLMSWIVKFVIESGWPQQIISMLKEIPDHGLEGNHKSTYQAFLVSLVKVSDHAAITLIKCDSLEVCRRHKMTELEAMLVKFFVHSVPSTQV